MMELSIVTGTRNRPDAFRRLVDSIAEHTHVSWELVVSDASDTPIEDQEVATEETWPHIVVIPERPRLGCTKGYNRAFRQARGEWVIWLNDDATVDADWAARAIYFMRNNPAIGLGALPYDDAPGRVPTINVAWGLPYANFGILRRELGDQVGWFDEEFEMYGNDNSLTFKILLAGYAIAEVPLAIVHHHPIHDDERVANERQKLAATTILERKYYHRIPEMMATQRRLGQQTFEFAYR